MLDRGIDALVHRLEDGAYLALQVKGKTALHSLSRERCSKPCRPRPLTGKTIGIQIKTRQFAQPKGHGEIHALRSSFVASWTTFVVALAWIVSERRFHENGLVIPSNLLPSIAYLFDGTHYELRFRPDSSRPTRLDRYRIPLESLTEALAKHL